MRPRRSVADRARLHASFRVPPAPWLPPVFLLSPELSGCPVHRLASHFTDDVLLAPRHRQRLVDAVQQHFPVRVAVVVRPALEAANEIARDQTVAMHADE